MNKISYRLFLFTLKAIPYVIALFYILFTKSIVGISLTTAPEQFFNTLVHEAKHVQSHICMYYNVKEDSEAAAYLIGYIIQKMYKCFKHFT